MNEQLATMISSQNTASLKVVAEGCNKQALLDIRKALLTKKSYLSPFCAKQSIILISSRSNIKSAEGDKGITSYRPLGLLTTNFSLSCSSRYYSTV